MTSEFLNLFEPKGQTEMSEAPSLLVVGETQVAADLKEAVKNGAYTALDGADVAENPLNIAADIALLKELYEFFKDNKQLFADFAALHKAAAAEGVSLVNVLAACVQAFAGVDIRQ